MKNILIIGLIGLLTIYSSNLISQNHYVKGFGITAILFNYASLSYEYALDSNNSLGVQATTYLYFDEMSSSYISNKGFVYYRYYPKLKPEKRIAIFGQVEVGYYESHNGKHSNTNITSGVLFGGRRFIGKSERFFADLAVGVNASYRMFHGDDQWYYDESYDEWFYSQHNPDRFIIVPRIIFEIGFKF